MMKSVVIVVEPKVTWAETGPAPSQFMAMGLLVPTDERVTVVIATVIPSVFNNVRNLFYLRSRFILVQ